MQRQGKRAARRGVGNAGAVMVGALAAAGMVCIAPAAAHATMMVEFRALSVTTADGRSISSDGKDVTAGVGDQIVIGAYLENFADAGPQAASGLAGFGMSFLASNGGAGWALNQNVATMTSSAAVKIVGIQLGGPAGLSDAFEYRSNGQETNRTNTSTATLVGGLQSGFLGPDHPAVEMGIGLGGDFLLATATYRVQKGAADQLAPDAYVAINTFEDNVNGAFGSMVIRGFDPVTGRLTANVSPTGSVGAPVKVHVLGSHGPETPTPPVAPPPVATPPVPAPAPVTPPPVQVAPPVDDGKPIGPPDPVTPPTGDPSPPPVDTADPPVRETDPVPLPHDGDGSTIVPVVELPIALRPDPVFYDDQNLTTVGFIFAQPAGSIGLSALSVLLPRATPVIFSGGGEFRPGPFVAYPPGRVTLGIASAGRLLAAANAGSPAPEPAGAVMLIAGAAAIAARRRRA